MLTVSETQANSRAFQRIKRAHPAIVCRYKGLCLILPGFSWYQTDNRWFFFRILGNYPQVSNSSGFKKTWAQVFRFLLPVPYRMHDTCEVTTPSLLSWTFLNPHSQKNRNRHIVADTEENFWIVFKALEQLQVSDPEPVKKNGFIP